MDSVAELRFLFMPASINHTGFTHGDRLSRHSAPVNYYSDTLQTGVKPPFFYTILPMFMACVHGRRSVHAASQGWINKCGGPIRKNCGAYTHRIKKKGQMTVFCSIFVTKYRHGLGYFEDESDTL